MTTITSAPASSLAFLARSTETSSTTSLFERRVDLVLEHPSTPVKTRDSIPIAGSWLRSVII
jgi:hypothetical protein